MKRLFFALLVFVCFSVCRAQIVLTEGNNAMRDGDELLKRQVEYAEPCRDGKMVIWDFRKLKTVDDGYLVKYCVYDDQTPALTVATEHRTMYYFRQKGDTLLMTGHENPNMKLDYSRAQLQLRFPFHYRDSCRAGFAGKGMYSNRRKMSVNGTAEVRADAYGVLLLPEGDTLRNVLRVRSVQKVQNAADEVVETEKYVWYTKGYRYPVLEMIRSTTKKNGAEAADYFRTGFYYPIVEQYRLATDEDNEAARDLGGDELFGYFTFYPNPCVDELRIDYNVKEDGTNVTFRLYDLRGQTLLQKEMRGLAFGSYSERLRVGSVASGQYLLEVRIGERTVVEKVIKK